MATRDLTVNILGKADGAKKALAETEKGAGGLGSKMSSMGTMAAAGMAGAAVAAGAFALKSADAFSKVGGEVIKLQRFTGGTAEDMSKLRFAAQQSGIGTDQLANSLKFLSKNMAAGNPEFAKLGVAAKDAHGNLRPVNDVMLDVAAKFEAMPNGAEKTAAAVKLFGKSGADMLPMLNKGKDGLVALQKEASKYGLVLSQDNLDAVKKATAGHRQMDAAMQGIQVTIGAYVLPVIATLTSWFAEQLPKGIGLAKTAIGFITTAWGYLTDGFKNGADNSFSSWINAFETIGARAGDIFYWIKSFIIDTVLPELIEVGSTAWTGIQEGIQWLADHKEILVGFGAVIAVVAGYIAVGLVASFLAWAAAAAMAAISTIIALAPLIALGLVIAAVVAAVVYAYNHWQWFHNAVNASVNWLKANVPPVFEAIKNALMVAFNWIATHVPPVFVAIGNAAMAFARFFMDNVWPIIQTVIGFIVGFIQDHWTQISSIFSSAIDMIKNIVSNGFAIIKGIFQIAIDIFTGDWSGAWDTIKSVVGSAWDLIKNVVSNGWDIVKNLFTTAKDFITGIGSTIWDGIKDAFKGVINWIIDHWNALKFSAPSMDLGPLGKVGGWTIGVPQIPRLAEGGIVRATPGGSLVRVGEAGVDEAVVPLDGRRGQPFGPSTIQYVTVQGSVIAERELVGRLALLGGRGLTTPWSTRTPGSR